MAPLSGLQRHGGGDCQVVIYFFRESNLSLSTLCVGVATCSGATEHTLNAKRRAFQKRVHCFSLPRL
jgi:hypothetical protein